MTSRFLPPAELWLELRNQLLDRSQHPAPLAWSKTGMPDPVNVGYQIVHMPKETLTRFKAQYAELTSFACMICGVDPKSLIGFDLVQAVERMYHVEEVLEAAKSLAEALPLDDPASAVAIRRIQHNLAALGRYGHGT